MKTGQENNGSVRERGSVRLMIPDTELTAADMRIDGKPYVGVLNSGLRGFDHHGAFSWFLSVIIEYDSTVGDGMPYEEDTLRMQHFADVLNEGLAGNPVHPNALFLGRVTGDCHTELMWYVNNPEEADHYLKNLIDRKTYPLDFDYEMPSDTEWEEASYWLGALE